MRVTVSLTRRDGRCNAVVLGGSVPCSGRTNPTTCLLLMRIFESNERPCMRRSSAQGTRCVCIRRISLDAHARTHGCTHRHTDTRTHGHTDTRHTRDNSFSFVHVRARARVCVCVSVYLCRACARACVHVVRIWTRPMPRRGECKVLPGPRTVFPRRSNWRQGVCLSLIHI